MQEKHDFDKLKKAMEYLIEILNEAKSVEEKVSGDIKSFILSFGAWDGIEILFRTFKNIDNAAFISNITLKKMPKEKDDKIRYKLPKCVFEIE